MSRRLYAVDITDEEDDIAETLRKEDVDESLRFFRGLLYATGASIAAYAAVVGLVILAWTVATR